MNIATHPVARAPLARGFEQIRSGPYQLHLNAETLPHAAEIGIALRELAAATATGAGNRRSGFRVALPAGPELFVRRARRGGAMRLLLNDLYVGVRPRPFVELAVAVEAIRRGVPLAEPMGAGVRWIGPGLYRGFFISRALTGMTLWEFIRTDDEPSVRGYVLERAREAIEKMLRAGLYHPDLNLHNLFVAPQGESFRVIILDLDKARLGDQPLDTKARLRIAERLARSARKLDPRGRFIDADALTILNPA